MTTFFRRAALVAAAAFGLVGCEDDASPVIVPPPPPCNLILTCTPLAGFSGVYACGVNESVEWTFVRDGTTQSVEFGNIAVAASGDLVQACAVGCGCTIAQRLR